MTTTDPTPVVRLEHAIRRAFSRRDELMPHGHELLAEQRIAELEQLASSLQLELADLVEPSDPARAARLRELAR